MLVPAARSWQVLYRQSGQRGIRTPVGLSPSDLQSDAIGRSAICPSMIISPSLPANGLASSEDRVLNICRVAGGPRSCDGYSLPAKLAVGLEPTTTGLQNQCSAVELR